MASVYKKTWSAHIAYSGYLANNKNMNWFDGNPSWEKMPNETAESGDLLYVWKKKE